MELAGAAVRMAGVRASAAEGQRFTFQRCGLFGRWRSRSAGAGVGIRIIGACCTLIIGIHSLRREVEDLVGLGGEVGQVVDRDVAGNQQSPGLGHHRRGRAGRRGPRREVAVGLVEARHGNLHHSNVVLLAPVQGAGRRRALHALGTPRPQVPQALLHVFQRHGLGGRGDGVLCEVADRRERLHGAGPHLLCLLPDVILVDEFEIAR
mmetsp:Transcript_93539/g.183388  ORF Transcript_93539/g.183388 Transcript_93539/m.183388 type:complete len:207 (+) Transcript_93539:144-764(+)